MPELRDVEEGWTLEFPGKRRRSYSLRDVVESGPEVDILNDRQKTTYNPVVLKVGYEANNPVIITWRVDGEVLRKMKNRVRQASTSLRLSSRWLREHPDSRYKVTIRDQEMNTRHGINPMSTSCRVSINIY